MAALIRALIASALLIAPLAVAASAVEPTSRVAQVQAAFLFNFAKFVEWPPSAFAAADSPLTIGVLGDNPFGQALDDTVRGETVGGRPLAVKRSARLSDLLDCQILYIGRSEAERVPEILKQVAGRPILTVSDIDGFGAGGGMIQFYLDGTKQRFLINPGAAQAAALKPSAQLLSVGKVVGKTVGSDGGGRRE